MPIHGAGLNIGEICYCWCWHFVSNHFLRWPQKTLIYMSDISCRQEWSLWGFIQTQAFACSFLSFQGRRSNPNLAPKRWRVGVLFFLYQLQESRWRSLPRRWNMAYHSPHHPPSIGHGGPHLPTSPMSIRGCAFVSISKSHNRSHPPASCNTIPNYWGKLEVPRVGWVLPFLFSVKYFF